MESLILVLKVVAISYLLIAAVTLILYMLNIMIGFMVYMKSGGNGGLKEYLIYLLDMTSFCSSIDAGAEIANRANNSMSELARFSSEEIEEDKTYVDVLNEDLEYWKDEIKEMSRREVLFHAIKPGLIIALGWPALPKTIASNLSSIKDGLTGLMNM